MNDQESAYGANGIVTGTPSGGVRKICSLFDSANYMNGNLFEAVLAATLTDGSMANVIRYHHVRVRGDNDICIDMERAELTLRKAVHVRRATRMTDVEWILQQVTAALNALHRRGIIHGDVKVDNVVLTGDRQARLIDFGSSRWIWRRPIVARRDASRGLIRRLLCTLLMCAPESLESGENPTFACDAFSLGCLLHFCIYGRDLVDAKIAPGCREDLKPLIDGKLKRMQAGGLVAIGDIGVKPRTLQIMLRLLDPDPVSRMTITDLYDELWPGVPAPMYNVYDLVDPDVIRRLDRHSVTLPIVHQLHDFCRSQRCMEAFALAVAVALAYAALTTSPASHVDKGKPMKVALVLACVPLAVSVLDPDNDWSVDDADERDAIRTVLRVIDCKAMPDTVDWLVVSMHGHCRIDYDVIYDVVCREPGNAFAASHLYLQQVPRCDCDRCR